VLRAIESLQSSPARTASTAPALSVGSDLRHSALIGIWADRNDIANNHDFARELRQKAEQRN
jgi:hypothetical protein